MSLRQSALPVRGTSTYCAHAMDVTDLRDYYMTPLGGLGQRLIATELRRLWPSVQGERVLGLGFSTPWLEMFTGEAERTLAFLSARRGLYHWPQGMPACSALVEDSDLPLVESAVDRVLVVHGLELADDAEEMLAEVWRVLSPQGRLLLVIPNRRGLWARFDTTPFGHGRPFTRSQILTLLKATSFIPVAWSQALFFPPSANSLVLRTGPAWERIATRLSPPFAGLHVVEAMKQVYAVSSAKRARRLLPRFKPVLAPALNPSYEGGHTSPEASH